MPCRQGHDLEPLDRYVDGNYPDVCGADGGKVDGMGGDQSGATALDIKSMAGEAVEHYTCK